MTNDPYASLNAPDPLNTSKWEDMSIGELESQRIILTNRISALDDMMYNDPNPSFVGVRTALQHAVDQLNTIISQRTIA